MNQEKELEINTKSKSYMLATSEYFGCTDPRYFLIRSELRDNNIVMLFLLGVDGLMVSAKYLGIKKEEITKKLYSAATESISQYLEKNGVKIGDVIYGQYLEDETFELGIQNPEWKNESWGQKIEEF